MLFKDSSILYSACPFDQRFIIQKNINIGSYELCIPNPNDYPSVVGWISIGDPGKITDAHNLGWRIDEEYRGQGLMSKLLEIFLQEVSPNGSCFAIVISRTNSSSLKMAQKAGFVIYDEDEDHFYLKK